LGQLAPVQSEELEAALPCVVAEALPLPEAEAPELGDAGVVLLPLDAPADVLLPLCAHAVASLAAATAIPIAFNIIGTSLDW
jgi:hypothetical protein